MSKNVSDLNVSVVETDFAELRDGTLVEMIEDPANPANSLLAVYQNGRAQYATKWRDRNKILVPLLRAGLTLEHVHFPQGAKRRHDRSAGPMGPMPEICQLLSLCVDVDPPSLLLMAAFVVSSWFPEKLSFAPYLSLVGPPGSGKTTALRLLSLLCRRGLLTADITSAAFYDICHRVAPTIFIDETRTAGDPRKLLHLLRASSSRGVVSLRKDKAQLAYGPKVLSWIELPNDPQFCSRCIILPMHRTTRRDLLSPDDPFILQLAARAREDLLHLRFERYSSLSVSTIPADQRLSGRMLDLYRGLALPFAEDPEVCKALGDLIVTQHQFQPDLLSPAQASALRLLHVFIHYHPADSGLRLSELTTSMSSDLESRGEPSQLNERKVGVLLTSLGLTNRTRANDGYVLWLNRSERVKVHNMVRDYEVDGVYFEADPESSCEICVQLSRPSSSRNATPVLNQDDTVVEKPKRERREHRERYPKRAKRR
jgi:hypothetical protein